MRKDPNLVLDEHDVYTGNIFNHFSTLVGSHRFEKNFLTRSFLKPMCFENTFSSSGAGAMPKKHSRKTHLSVSEVSCKVFFHLTFRVRGKGRAVMPTRIAEPPSSSSFAKCRSEVHGVSEAQLG